MTCIRINCNGGYEGIDSIVGKTVYATKILGHWSVFATEFKVHECPTIIPEYVFFDREVTVQWPQ